nr:immunoglobulin heavy chain junction region [Macaca mulatta]MOX38894.1 immunoglobulin heavy chain junction region [Macaca mulatta]MOX39184.1 immunoglobulin heavy chain junction region [Macaca mulatta]MOX39718.1 immunoglobulin heavy chain junction region [Macaca mulatta]MOX40348.1 immunoglobulin heavy chain junction region [Macaca mulatta]
CARSVYYEDDSGYFYAGYFDYW